MIPIKYINIVLIIFIILPVTLFGSEKYQISDATSCVNGKLVDAEEYTFNADLFSNQHQLTIPDKLTIKIDESGFVNLLTHKLGSSYLFATGEVEQFVSVLKKAKEDAKHARFSKQAGSFRVGVVGGGLIVTLETTSGGNLEYFSLFLKAIVPDHNWIEHRIYQNDIDAMIEVLLKKDEIISKLSGETDKIKIVKLSMTSPGGITASGGLTLKIEKFMDRTEFWDESVNFKWIVNNNEIKNLSHGLESAFEYLKLANATYEELPDKEFDLGQVGKQKVKGRVNSFSGNSDRYKFITYLTGVDDVAPRGVLISEYQLGRLIQILR